MEHMTIFFLYGEPNETIPYKHIIIKWHFTEFHIFQPKEQPFDVYDYYYKYWGTAKLVSIKEYMLETEIEHWANRNGLDSLIGIGDIKIASICVNAIRRELILSQQHFDKIKELEDGNN